MCKDKHGIHTAVATKVLFVTDLVRKNVGSDPSQVSVVRGRTDFETTAEHQ